MENRIELVIDKNRYGNIIIKADVYCNGQYATTGYQTYMYYTKKEAEKLFRQQFNLVGKKTERYDFT